MRNDYSGSEQFSWGDPSSLADDRSGVDRRTFLQGALGSALVVDGVAAENATTTQPDADWPMFQHDAANTGAVESTTPPNGISERWHDESMATSRSAWDLPAIVDETVYHVHWLAGDDETKVLTAYDAVDGIGRWASPFDPNDPELRGPPAVADGQVFVAGQSLHAVDAATGTGQWTLGLGDQPTAPTVAGGTVFVAAGNTIHAVNTRNGTVQWSRGLPGDVGQISAPAVADGRVFVHADGVIHAFDGNDGSQYWRSSTGWLASAMTVAEGAVLAIGYSGDDDGASFVIYALRAGDGTERWTADTPSARGSLFASGLSTAAGRVYFFLGGLSADESPPFGLYAYDLQSGNQLWVNDELWFGEPIPPTPVVVGDTVVVGGHGGKLWAVDARTGEIRWETSYGGNARAHPVATDAGLYVTGIPNDAQEPEAGNLYALEFVEDDTGAERTFEVTKGTQPDGLATYVLAVDGDVSPNDDFEDSTCLGNDPPFVFGRVGPERGTDSVGFTGEILFADVFGAAELYLDGERIRPGDVAPGLPNRLVVTKEGAPDGRAEFQATVSGVLAPEPAVEAIPERTGCGTIRESVGPESGMDSFHYSGRITEFTLDGPATVYRNGEEVDPGELGEDSGNGERTFRVTKGTQPDGLATYVLAVDGDISPSDDFEDSTCLDSDPPYVFGRVGPERGTDSVTFTGDLVAADVYGPAELYVDGERTTPGQLGTALPNRLVVTKEGAPEGRAEFEVTVSDVLAPEPAIEAIPERTGCGTIQESVGPESGTDSFHYLGRITGFTLDGPATVYRNGEEVDPEDLG